MARDFWLSNILPLSTSLAIIKSRFFSISFFLPFFSISLLSAAKPITILGLFLLVEIYFNISGFSVSSILRSLFAAFLIFDEE